MAVPRLNSILKIISSLGYPGLFFGLIIEFLGMPFPGEIVLTFAGFLVWNGHLNFGVALISAVFGSVTGTLIAYFIGRKFGRPFLDRYGRYVFLNKRKIDRAERWFNRHSFIVLLLGRFVSGVRPLSAYMAGIARMKIMVFLPLSFLGTLIWCLTFILLGRYMGKKWEVILVFLENYNLLIMAVVIGIIGLYIMWRRFASKKQEHNLHNNKRAK